ncbi:MAG: DMT family transporter [Rhodobacteraceae bacterium]|nr:DMT family transporter [Paracoccaceae bacterium]
MFDRLSDASKGAVFLVSGISIFGFSDNLTLLVSDSVSVGQFHFSRSLIAMFMVIVAARLFGMPVLAKLWKPIAARTVFMVTSMLLYFGAMPMMPIAEAGAGLFTSPIFVLLFSAILFGERIGFRRILAVLVGSVGVWCVLQPGAEGVTVYQIMPILAGAITFRYLQDESAFAILFSFLVAIGISGALIASVFTLFPASDHLIATAPFLFSGWQTVDAQYWLYLFIIALGATVALSLMTRAYQLAQTSYAAIFEYTYLLSVSYFSWLFWDVTPNALGVVGIVFIIASGVIITLAQRKTI